MFVSADYAVLAPIYDRIGLSDFAAGITPRLLNFAQRNEWLGRRILDLGCGTGGCTLWFARHSYNVISVDNSPAMLAQLRASLGPNGSNVRVLEGDIRNLEAVDLVETIDMAIALGVMNNMANLRELEAIFKGVSARLQSGKFFIFDMVTIQGLTERGQAGDRLVANESDLVVVSHNAYDFERQMNTRDYHIFSQDEDGTTWSRAFSQMRLRAYPVQAVATLLGRHEFDFVALTDEQLDTYDLASSSASRVIFILRKR